MDIVILGGGVVGLTLANLLAKQRNYRIAIISPTAVPDRRYSALNHASKNIFKHLQVWDQIIATPPGMYDQMYLWEEGSATEITIRATELGATELGHIVHNSVLLNCLENNLQDVTRIEGMAAKIEHAADHVKIQVNDQIITTKLVIGADGANSWLRQQLQIENYNWDYKHQAIVATVRLHEPHANTAKQKFSTLGPLAFLPLADQYTCSIVWSTAPDHAAWLMQLSDQEFAAELKVAALCSPRSSFTLQMLHAKSYTAPRAVLVGDAAHVIHPLAGQGMNLGLLDAATLAECLDGSVDPGANGVLRKYERWRKTNTWGMIALMEGCKRIFETHNPIINAARNFGMQAIDQAQPVKNLLAKVGMGVLGEMPQSARSLW